MKITDRIHEKLKNKKQKPILISFLGDSVTQGCFELYPHSTDGFQTVFRPGEAYCQKLKRLIETVIPDVTINILNAGLSGDKSYDGADRLERDIIAYKPDLCVVCYGLNDLTRGSEHLECYASSLDSIFSRLDEAGIEVIFMTPNMISTYVSDEITIPRLRTVAEHVTERFSDGTYDLFMDKTREICEKNNVPICDCSKKWQQLYSMGADVTRLLANRINHPTEDMHWLFAASLFEMIMGMA